MNDELGLFPEGETGTSSDPLGLGSSNPASDDTMGLFDSQDQIEQKRDSRVGPWEAGWNKSQAMMWEGLASGGEALGLDENEYVRKAIEENNAIAGSANIEDFSDKLKFAVGQVGPAAAGAATAAFIAPYIGMTSALGATIGGAAASWGMTLGDLKEKELELDPLHKSDWADIGYGTVMTAPDAFAINKLKYVTAPMYELIEASVKGTMGASRGMALAGRTVTDMAKIGGAEGLQDLGTGLGANLLTGTDIDESRIRSLASSAWEEAAIGGILGLPVSGLNTYTAHVASRQMEFDQRAVDQLEADRVKQAEFEDRTGMKGMNIYEIRDFMGDVNEDAMLVPMPESTKQPGFFSLAFNTLTGNISDVGKVTNPNNGPLQALYQQFNLTPKERRPGRRTITEKSTLWTGELTGRLGDPFFRASDADRQAAFDRKATGNLDRTNPVDNALFEMLHGDRMHQIVIEASRGQIDVTEKDSLWTDPTYLPNNTSWEAIFKDMRNWETNLRLDALAEGKLSEEQTTALAGLIKAKLADYQTYGNAMHTGEVSSRKYENGMIDGLEEQLNEPTHEGRVRGLINRIAGRPDTIARQSPLTLERLLKDAPTKFLERYSDKGKSPAERMAAHVKKNMDHAAVIDSFGVNLEGFHELVARSIVEARDLAARNPANNAPLTKRDIERMYDALRTQQRIHLKPVTKAWRERQSMAKALMNTNLLGLSALVSIPESIGIMMNTDFRTAIAGLGATLKVNGKSYTQMNANEKASALVAVQDLNLSAASAAQSVANRTNQDQLSRTEEVFFKYLTGLPQLQQFLSTWGAKSMDIHYRKLIDQATNLKSSEAMRNHAIMKMATLGIDAEKANTWKETGYSQESEYYLTEYLPALLQGTRDTIVDPNPVDKPAWQNNEHLQLVSHLKGFMTVFTNRVMRGVQQKQASRGPAGNRELLARVLPYTAAYIVGQMGVGMLRELLRDGEVDDAKTAHARAVAAFGYIGAVSYFTDAYNSLKWNSDPFASAAGPAFSITSQLAGATVSSIENTDPDQLIKKVIERMIPNTIGAGAIREVLVEAAQ